MSLNRITELATTIQINTIKIDYFLSSNGIATPSFHVSTPLSLKLPDDLAICRLNILEAAGELSALIKGPVESLSLLSLHGSPSFHAIYRYKMALSFPIGETSTFSQIAERCGLDEPTTRRILRTAMTDHVFCEPEEGVVAHTIATKALVHVPLLDQWIGLFLEELWPAATRMVDAMTAWPGSQEPENAGFTLAHGVKESFFNELHRQPDRAKRFQDAMMFLQSAPGFEPYHVVQAYDWGALGKETIVDIGGSHGNISIELARNFPSLNFVIQDLPDTVAKASSICPPDVVDRVKWMAHDCFEEQPVKNAAVYYFRWIFHDWPDKYCIKMLQALIPALKNGARIFVNDFCLPEHGKVSMYKEKILRAFDMTMMLQGNGKERGKDDWHQLFQAADARLKLRSIKVPPKSRLAMIEAIWEDHHEPLEGKKDDVNIPSDLQHEPVKAKEDEVNGVSTSHDAAPVAVVDSHDSIDSLAERSEMPQVTPTPSSTTTTTEVLVEAMA